MKRKMTNGKRCLAGVLVMIMTLSLCACGSSKEKVTLSIWAAEAKSEYVEQVIKSFQDLHSDEIELVYHVSHEEENTCKETILSNVEGAADIFSFADDQLDELKEAGALLAIPTDPNTALKSFGGSDSVAWESVVRDGKMYAYPDTANGYFLYYNKQYYDENDITSLDRMVQIAGNSHKTFTMDLSSGWYLYSFFQGAGLELHVDESGQKNICNWAEDARGLQVTKAIAKLAVQTGFKSLTDEDFIRGVQNGKIIAGVNGAWNSDKIRRAWGANFAAAKLPSYRLGDEEVQMASFTGYKVIGINAHTQYPEWCQRLVEYLTSKENQILEFEKTGEVPANLDVAEDDAVKESPAVKALSDQSHYATLQRVAPSYWDASGKLGIALGSGNPDKKPLKELLNNAVEEIIS